MSRTPVVRQISWPAVLPQFVALGGAMAIGVLVTRTSNGPILGAAATTNKTRNRRLIGYMPPLPVTSTTPQAMGSSISGVVVGIASVCASFHLHRRRHV